MNMDYSDGPYGTMPECELTLPGLYEVNQTTASKARTPRTLTMPKAEPYPFEKGPSGWGDNIAGTILGGGLGFTASISTVGSALQQIPYEPNHIYLVQEAPIIMMIALSTILGAYACSKIFRASSKMNQQKAQF